MAEYTPKKPKGKYTPKAKPVGYQRNTDFPYGDAPGRLDGLSTAMQMTPGLSFGGAPAVVPSAWDKTFGQSFDPRPSVGAVNAAQGIWDGQTLFDAAGSAGLMDTQGINQFQFGKPTLANSPSFGVTAPLPVDPPKSFSFADWGSKNKDLIAGGVGIANSLANAYFGWKNMGLAKDQFNFQKDSWNKNFANQVITTNNQLEEQARKRYSNSPTSNMTPEEYMAKHRVQ